MQEPRVRIIAWRLIKKMQALETEDQRYERLCAAILVEFEREGVRTRLMLECTALAQFVMADALADRGHDVVPVR
jgi:hypothetical protein